MAKFGKASLEKLKELHPDLQMVLSELIEYFDFTILQGYRGEAEQNKAFAEGLSKSKYPDSKHNRKPSDAVDIAPYPIDWNKRGRFLLLMGAAICIARRLKKEGKIKSSIRAGADWNVNDDPDDEKFIDLPHLERY